MMRQFKFLMLVQLLFCFLRFSFCYDINDEVTYSIRWTEATSDASQELQNLKLRTAIGENYECVLPDSSIITHSPSTGSEKVANESELLKPLFTMKSCSVRTEGYWTYELCHNRHIRQYHESISENKKSEQTQEYFLGYYQPVDLLNKEADSATSDKVIALGDATFPYYSTEYSDGTLCELNSQHRRATVLYICSESLSGNIIEVIEVETCRYQIVFATNYLCSHPTYERKVSSAKVISCQPQEGSPVKPAALVELLKEQENNKQYLAQNLASVFKGLNLKNIRIQARRENNMIVYSITADEKDSDSKSPMIQSLGEGAGAQQVEETLGTEQLDAAPDDYLPPVSIPQAQPTRDEPSKPQPSEQSPSSAPSGLAEVHDFIRGKMCLSTKSGWWSYDVCLNSLVRQYHVDRATNARTEIILGRWNLEKHIEWLKNNPSHLPSSNLANRNEVTLYYGDGHLCPGTNTPRETMVKLRCLRSPGTSIYISLSEPVTCVYSVSVESPAFCSLLPQTNEFGIIP